MVSGNGLRLSSAERGIDGPSSWPRAPFGAMPRRIDGLRPDDAAAGLLPAYGKRSDQETEGLLSDI